MRKFGFFLLLIVIPICGLAQGRVDPNIEKITFDGISSFSVLPFEKLVEKTTKPREILIEGIKVTITSNQLRKSVFVNTETCHDDDKPYQNSDFFLRVPKYFSYAVDDKVFAYQVIYEFFDYASGQEVGASSYEFYIATKRKNSFVIHCLGTGLGADYELEHVPEWVKPKHK